MAKCPNLCNGSYEKKYRLSSNVPLYSSLGQRGLHRKKIYRNKQRMKARKDY
jgi:hypothetical protein